MKATKARGNVAAVNEGAPWRAVRHDADFAGGDGAGEEIVDDEVDAQHRRMAIGGGVAQIGRRESLCRPVSKTACSVSILDLA